MLKSYILNGEYLLPCGLFFHQDPFNSLTLVAAVIVHVPIKNC